MGFLQAMPVATLGVPLTMDRMRKPLLIVGASARAAAQCAIRAGFDPFCVDLFADVDTQACAEVLVASPFPEQIPQLAAQFPTAPFMLTGAMENHIPIVRHLMKQRTLYGNSIETLTAARDPIRLAQALVDHGLPTPAVHSHADALCGDSLWLRKPRTGSGGHGIAFFNPHTRNKDVPRNSYYQQYIAGPSLSGVFIAGHDGVQLLGVSRQLVGTPWLGAGPFAYAGSIGPMSLDTASQENWLRIGEVLSQAFTLRGLFGVDAIFSQNTIYPVELNPRFTASVEIFERAFSLKTIRDHVLACCGGHLESQTNSRTKDCYGKAVLFARKEIVIPAAILHLAAELHADESWPVLADIPHEGTTIRSGRPILTLMAAGRGESAVIDRLQQLTRRVQRVLRVNASTESAARRLDRNSLQAP